ncbi:hypothetical protein B0J14DRAFT_650932 [Halenospora varia]|nr:hypothetical protein B0J14DRAFT_650932 [Halenospora varia]
MSQEEARLSTIIERVDLGMLTIAIFMGMAIVWDRGFMVQIVIVIITTDVIDT